VSSPDAALDCMAPQPDTPSSAPPAAFRKVRQLYPRSPDLFTTATGVSLPLAAILVYDRFCPISSHPNCAVSLFGQHHRITLHTYLTRLRVWQAQCLLISTGRKISEIAFQTAFGSISRCYEACKAVGGTTSLRYRLLPRLC
jgi:AraC-like DNA-binding protein